MTDTNEILLRQIEKLVRHVVCLRIVEGGTPSEKGVQPHRS